MGTASRWTARDIRMQDVVERELEQHKRANQDLPELAGTISPIARWLACEHRTLHERPDPTVSNLVVRDAQTTEDYYNKWRKSIPLERVQLQPMLLQEPEFMRTEQRAIPTEMRSVLIASRELCSTTILYCLLITYQPGRPGEKALLLKHLTEVTGGKDWAEAGANFRNWRRFL